MVRSANPIEAIHLFQTIRIVGPIISLNIL